MHILSIHLYALFYHCDKYTGRMSNLMAYSVLTSLLAIVLIRPKAEELGGRLRSVTLPPASTVGTEYNKYISSYKNEISEQ